MDKARFYREEIGKALEGALPAPSPQDPQGLVAEAMRYSLLCGGKRVRPVLTLAFCELCGGEPLGALPFACAVEMVHTYSLIHDDMPCMDDDAMRRGRPTNHRVYGEAMALLAGDGLLTMAFETALGFSGDPQAALDGARLLAQCAGAKGMVGGQCIDLQSDGGKMSVELLQAMDKGKTVALIHAACGMGCIAAGAQEGQLLAAGRYAHGLGMAFQLRDDILDVEGSAEKLGKETGMDAARSKQNYVSLLGLEEAKRLVERYTQEAVRALEGFPGDKGFLRDFALGLASREN
ncbi:polyprenyl synthetase family protein [bacterium D16-76]|nr:polyprenyl synthetase family protein [bacterium D16-76]